MQRKSGLSEPVTAEGKDFQDVMLPVNGPELRKLLTQSKYPGREPRNSVNIDDIIKSREDKEFENGGKTLWLFIALAALLLIGLGLLPKSPVPVSGVTVTSVSVPESESATTQLFTVKETYTTKSP